VRLTETIVLADRVHEALVSLSDGASVFTGCDSHREPLHGNRHAYIFCESNGRQAENDEGKITHIVIYAPMGFGSSDLKVLANLNEIWGENDLRVTVALQGLGQPEDFAANSAENSVGMDAGHPFCPLLSRSLIWVSRTPFIPTRHTKVTRAGALKLDGRSLQIGSPEHEVRRLLELENLPEISSVDQVAGTLLGKKQIEWSGFMLLRDGGRGRRAECRGYGFRIEFSEPVQGPIAVGYGAHFGMGLFIPEDGECIKEIQPDERI
jgi:CRISPR-associated protein Csb2